MKWEKIASPEYRGLTVWFTNEGANTDFSISEQTGKCKVAIHTAANRDGEFLKIVFRELSDAKTYCEELNKTENPPAVTPVVDFLAACLDGSQPAMQRH